MSKLILTRGIPASGKSTWSKAWVQEDPERRVRVNRDDLRRMLYGTTDTLLGWVQEQNVTAVERAIAKVALEKGKDVVVDAMNLRAKYVRQWFALGYPVEFRDFEVSLEDAIVRNEMRGSTVPDEAIANLWYKFTDNGKLSPPPADEKPQGEKYVADWSLPGAYIFDIDGTLAHIPEGGRSPYDYTRVSEDLVDEQVRNLLYNLAEANHVIIMSGREDVCSAETEKWLRDNRISYDHLIMRAAGDKRKDATVKLELFNEHVRGQYNVHGVIDDRNQVVRAWRDIGLKVYQVADGDF